MNFLWLQVVVVISLFKTRWFKAYENYYLLFKFIVATFDSICNPHLYEDFYKCLENETIENWCWDSESINKAQGLFAVCRKFDHIIAFPVLFHGLEPTKPLVTKLQKRNQDVYQAYCMIDKVLRVLRDIQLNIDTEFKVWLTFAVDMAKSVGVEPSLPRTARCWSRYRNNVPGEDSETYYRRSIAIPVMNDLITNFRDQMSDRNHTEIFALLPSICLSPDFDIEQSSAKLYELLKTEFNLATLFTIFRSEVKRWLKYCEYRIKPVDEQKQKLRVDSKPAYQLLEPSDNFINALQMADPDSFPNIRTLLTIGCVSLIGSTETGCAASGIRRLKTPYRSTMNDSREGDLNLIQLQKVTEIDISKVAQIFVNLNRRRLFT